MYDQITYGNEERKPEKKLTFYSSIGNIIDDSLILFSPKTREISLKDIVLVELKKSNVFVYKLLIFLSSLLLLIFGILRKEKFIVIVLLCLIISVIMFYENKYYYISILRKNSAKIKIRLKKSQLKKGQIFVNKLRICKGKFKSTIN